MLTELSIQGAREHNLKDISVTMPRDKLIVITGLSGSGKSSLAFDTIYAEGQRRYVESLSAYARQFLELMQKPDVDQIDGLSPAISIEQKTTSKNPRSTVGTVTEIYDYMRLLWARVGVPYSPATGKPIESQSASQMVDRIMMMDEGTKLYILAPIVRGRKGEYRKELQDFGRQGFQRVRIDGEFYEMDDLPTLNKKIKHNIDIVIDRLVLKADMGNRLADSVETGLRISDGLLMAFDAKTEKETLFSEKFACPISGFTIAEIEPRMFSFNSPHGACPQCDGLGLDTRFDPDLVVPDHSKSLKDGAVAPWSKSFAPYYMQALETVVKHFGHDMKTPWRDLPEEVQDALLHGTKFPLTFVYKDKSREFSSTKPFEGVITSLRRRLIETDSASVRDELANYQSASPCKACDGYRLKEETRAIKINGKHIGEVTALSIENAHIWFEDLPNHLSKQQQEIAYRILKEIVERLSFLRNVGLDYLTLARKSGTLSGGESQRIRLASQIGSGLTGVLYVLDEPSIGLHQRDNNRLLETLTRLRNLGNTVIVVEHDEDAIRSADHVIDMGPGAGIHGGMVVAEGTPAEIIANKDSITGQYLSGTRKIDVPTKRRSAKTETLKGKKKKLSIDIIGARGNNLKDVNVSYPLGIFTCVTGVSGSGKSTLTLETLYKAAARQLNRAKDMPAPHDEIKGLEHLDKIIDIDQGPIGRTPRSNPATYTGTFGPIRDWFAGLPESKARGYTAGRFSFNVKGGRCENCQGDGMIKIEMHFLPDVYVTCEHCHGKRYNRETLEVKYKGQSISDVLDMSIEESADFFAAVPTIYGKLETLKSVGLGYIKLGQPATTLSGGEAQRVKLSKELAKRATGKTLYILDEPTTGLHFEDVRKLLEVLHRLVDHGNTVIVIEHNLDVIKTADHVIDIGPEGGDKGGMVVSYGTPEKVAQCPESYTGQFLKDML
tara:strand:+ start:704560 stop:707403 length:2844 start_codon:yes stop_codon:yes gene_type:complete